MSAWEHEIGRSRVARGVVFGLAIEVVVAAALFGVAALFAWFTA